MQVPSRRCGWATVPLARWTIALLACAVLALGGTGSSSRAQQPPSGETLPPPRLVAGAYTAAASVPGVEPISLKAALCLAMTSNLDIAQAQAAIQQYEAALLRARALALPTLNLGDTYTHHDGAIQKTEGNIILANKDSDFLGGGPSLQFQLADAIFAPLAARQVAIAGKAGLERVTDETLLAVAEAYFNLLRARRRLARIDLTLEFLTSQQRTAARGDSKGLVPLIADIVELGGRDAYRADLERVRAEVLRREEEKAGIVLEYQLAVAELARLLRLDPALPLCPIEDFRVPLELPGDDWLCRSMEELVTFALSTRPETVESRALVEASVARVKAAKFRPLLPNVIVNYNWGDFGGGPDLNPNIVKPATTPGGAPTVTTQPGFGGSGRIDRFRTRDDFDATLVWRLQGLGLGNRAEVKEQKSLYQQAILRQMQVHDRIATQVITAREQIDSWWQQFVIVRAALFTDQGAPEGPIFRSVRLNFERVRGGEGRPLELIDSIRGLNDLIEDYGLDMTAYERSRFRLLIALGLPAKSFCPLVGVPAPPPADAAAAPAP